MLTQILRELIEKAKISGEPKEKPLNGGLYILIRPRADGVILTLYRIAVDPSVREWNTVIAFWPWKLGAIDWTDSGVSENGRHYKQAFIHY